MLVKTKLQPFKHNFKIFSLITILLNLSCVMTNYSFSVIAQDVLFILVKIQTCTCLTTEKNQKFLKQDLTILKFCHSEFVISIRNKKPIF